MLKSNKRNAQDEKASRTTKRCKRAPSRPRLSSVDSKDIFVPPLSLPDAHSSNALCPSMPSFTLGSSSVADSPKDVAESGRSIVSTHPDLAASRLEADMGSFSLFTVGSKDKEHHTPTESKSVSVSGPFKDLQSVSAIDFSSLLNTNDVCSKDPEDESLSSAYGSSSSSESSSSFASGKPRSF